VLAVIVIDYFDCDPAMLVQQAKEAGHKRWDHRIKIHRRLAVIVIDCLDCVPAMLVQQAKEAGHKRWDHRIKIHRRGISY
jgi:hypothetical protein